MRRTEARHDALRAASDGRLTFDSGMALSKGSFWVRLPGMAENETTSSHSFSNAVRQLIDGDYLRHEHPGVPRRSGKVLVTDAGLALLEHFDAQTTDA